MFRDMFKMQSWANPRECQTLQVLPLWKEIFPRSITYPALTTNNIVNTRTRQRTIKKNTLRFNPTNQFDYEYDLKILTGNFTNTTSGISSIDVGPINIAAFIGKVNSNQTFNVRNRFFRWLCLEVKHTKFERGFWS